MVRPTIPLRIEAELRVRPGLTERALAEALFPDDGYVQRINGACRAMVAAGRLRREGFGGQFDPYRYFAR